MEYTTIWRFSVKAVRQGQFPHEYPSTSLVSNFQQLQSNLTWQLFLKFILFYFSPTPKTDLRFHFQWSCAQTDDLHVFLTIDWHLFIYSSSMTVVRRHHPSFMAVKDRISVSCYAVIQASFSFWCLRGISNGTSFPSCHFSQQVNR